VIEHRHLLAFIAVAETQHFGRAAQRLFVSQPALSRTVRQLEDSVGVPLLSRTTRRVLVTPAGLAFLERARSLLEGVGEAVQAARRVASGEVGRVRVAYMDFAILGVLPQLVAGFRTLYPEIQVELRYSWTQRQKRELLAGEIDVGFMIGPFHGPGVRTMEVARERYVAVLPAGHRLARRAGLRLADLAREQFVFGVREEWGPMHEAVSRLCNRAGFEPRVVQEAHSRDGIFGFVAAGLGVAVYTEAALNAPRRGVSIRLLEGVEEQVEIVAAWKAGEPSPVRARFLTHLEAFLAAQALPSPAPGQRRR
jgi:DNA-binding transcriptional LysR family regulator